jgi:RimJ/RimL family protein N-acetyltransferase
MTRYVLTWNELTAVEPTPAELAEHAAALSAGYNDPANAELMGHTAQISPAEVVESYTDGIENGMRVFVLLERGVLAGDADLRGLRGGCAEFAFMIAAPRAQGKGLGTRFALMVHGFGFRALGLDRIYASVVPHNIASRRVFDKLGYVVDGSAAAREYADEPGDVTLALDRASFARMHGDAVAQIRMEVRP